MGVNRLGGKLSTNKLARAIGSGKGKACRQIFLQLKGGNSDFAKRLMDIWRRQRIPIYNRYGDCVAEIRFYRNNSELKDAKERALRGVSKAFVAMV